jgi:hypothetical protein
VFRPRPTQRDPLRAFAQVRKRDPRFGFVQIRACPPRLLRDEEAADSMSPVGAPRWRENCAWGCRPTPLRSWQLSPTPQP